MYQDEPKLSKAKEGNLRTVSNRLERTSSWSKSCGGPSDAAECKAA